MLGLDCSIRKEPYIIDLVKQLFPDVKWSVNRGFDSSSRRPDLMADMSTHIVVVEIDENQHRSYKPSTEKRRIDEICNAVNGRPIVFIRFNPDKYEHANGKKIKTCWNCDGIIDGQQLQWQNRVTILESEIRKWLVTVPSTLEIIQLFYDGWNTS